MKKILGISLVAMMAVTTARADIASKQYVDNNFQGKALITKTSGFENSDYVTTTYPSMATAKAIAETVAGGVGSVELTGYSKGDSAAAVAATDTLNQAVSKLENQIDTKISANTAITGATKTKITYDANGLVTAGADLEESDIPTLTLSKISDAGSAAALSSTTTITEGGAGLPTAGTVYTALAAKANASDLDAYESKSAVTSKGSTTIPVYFDENGVATPITSYAGNAATATSAASADAVAWSGISDKPTTLADYGITDAQGAITNVASTAESGKVVTGVSQTNGQIAATMADPLSVTNYTEQSDALDNVDGQYVLTKKVTAGVASFAWELITRGN